MRPRGVLPVIGLLLAASAVAWAIDLRDMPPWMRDMIRPVYIDWQQVAEQASLDPAGVHIWAPQQSGPAPAGVRVAAPGGVPVTAAVGSASPVDGAITPPRVTLSGSGGAEAPGGTAVRVPGAVALPGHGSVHVQGLGSELVGGSPVTVGGAGALSLPQSVSLSQTADQWDAMLASIEGMDEKSLAQAGQIITMVREQALTEEEFVRWVHEHGASLAAITGAYRLLTRNKPYWNEEARIVCAALSDAAGPNLEHLEDIPVEGRPGLATYVGLGGREDDVRAVLQSIPESYLDRLHPNPYYVTACTLFDQHTGLSTAIWAWKTEATRRGVFERIQISRDIRLACGRAHGEIDVREVLLPWVEELIATPEGKTRMETLMPVAIWAYHRAGAPEKALALVNDWLPTLPEGSLPSIGMADTLRVVALALANAGHLEMALRMLRRVVNTAPPVVAERAEADILHLSFVHPRDASAAVVPRLLSYHPHELTVASETGHVPCAEVVIRGNATLRVQNAMFDLGGTRGEAISLSEDAPGGAVTVTRVRLHARRDAVLAETHGKLQVFTNDDRMQVLTIPVSIEPARPVSLVPRVLFFGVIGAGETCEARARLEGPTLPTIKSVEAAGLGGLIAARAVTTDAGKHELRASLRAEIAPGVYEGDLVLSTEPHGAGPIRGAYYVHVLDPRQRDEQ